MGSRAARCCTNCGKTIGDAGKGLYCSEACKEAETAKGLQTLSLAKVDEAALLRYDGIFWELIRATIIPEVMLAMRAPEMGYIPGSVLVFDGPISSRRLDKGNLRPAFHFIRMGELLKTATTGAETVREFFRKAGSGANVRRKLAAVAWISHGDVRWQTVGWLCNLTA